MNLFRVFIVVVCISALGFGCAEEKVAAESAKPGSWALKLGKSLQETTKEQQAVAIPHMNKVVSEITLSDEKITLKKLKRDGWKGTLDLVDAEACYIKFTRGEEWGVVPGSFGKCPSDQIDKSGKLTKNVKAAKAERMKKAQEWKDGLKRDEAEASNSEASELYAGVLRITEQMITYPDVNIGDCIEDVSEVLAELRAAALAEECGKAPSSKSVMASLGSQLRTWGLVNDDWSMKTADDAKKAVAAVAAVADAPKGESDDDGADKPAPKKEDPRKVAVEKYVAWMKSVAGDNARVLMSQYGDTACLDKWMFDNDGVKELFGLEQAGKLCTSSPSGKAEKAVSRLGSSR